MQNTDTVVTTLNVLAVLLCDASLSLEAASTSGETALMACAPLEDGNLIFKFHQVKSEY